MEYIDTAKYNIVTALVHIRSSCSVPVHAWTVVLVYSSDLSDLWAEMVSPRQVVLKLEESDLPEEDRLSQYHIVWVATHFVTRSCLALLCSLYFEFNISSSVSYVCLVTNMSTHAYDMPVSMYSTSQTKRNDVFLITSVGCDSTVPCPLDLFPGPREN